MEHEFYRLIITHNAKTGFVAVGTTYPARPGEKWDTGSDIVDGQGPEIWSEVQELLKFLANDPNSTPEEWKDMRFGQPKAINP